MSVSYHVVGVRDEVYQASRVCGDANTAFDCFDSEVKFAKEKGGPTLWVLLEDRDGEVICHKSVTSGISQASRVFWSHFANMIESALGKGRYPSISIIPQDMI